MPTENVSHEHPSEPHPSQALQKLKFSVRSLRPRPMRIFSLMDLEDCSEQSRASWPSGPSVRQAKPETSGQTSVVRETSAQRSMACAWQSLPIRVSTFP